MKKTTLVARLLCLVLILCTLVGTFAACTGGKEDPKNSGDTATTKGPEQTSDPTQNEATPPTLSRKIRLLYTKTKEGGILGSDQNTDIVARATYDRWKQVEEDLTAEIVWVGVNGEKWSGSEPANFTKNVETAQSGSEPYDAMLLYNLYPSMLAYKGLAQNLYNGKHLQKEKAWWPQIYIEELTVNDSLYGIAENSSKNTLCNLHGVFFNNTLIQSHKLTDHPYDMVKNNTWTFANMMALVKDTWSDKNDNGKKDDGDFFGLVTGTEAKIETWFFSMGYRYATRDESTGEIKLNLGDTDYMNKWIDEFNAAHKTNDFLIHDVSHTKAFVEERAILYATSVQLVDSMVSREISIDYGVVPFPKQSSAQENYISVVANHHVVWAIPINVDLDESSAILDWMAYRAYKIIAPVYYEQCMKIRYAPDERLADMYDLIRSTLAVDLCQLYTMSYTTDPRTLITRCTDGNSNWVDEWGKISTQFTGEFEDILAKLYS